MPSPYQVGNDFGDVQRNENAAQQMRQQAWQQANAQLMQERQMQMEQQKMKQQQDYQKSLMEFGYGGRQGALAQQSQLDLEKQRLNLQKQQMENGDTGPAARAKTFRWNMAHQEALEGSFEKENYPDLPKDLTTSFQSMSDNAYATKNEQAENANNLATLHNHERDLADRKAALEPLLQDLHRTLLPNKTTTYQAAGIAPPQGASPTDLLTLDAVKKQYDATTKELERVTTTLRPFHDNKSVEGMVTVGPLGRFVGVTHVPYRKNPPKISRAAPLPEEQGVDKGTGPSVEAPQGWEETTPGSGWQRPKRSMLPPTSGTGTSGAGEAPAAATAPAPAAANGGISWDDYLLNRREE